jgi:adenine phosphoribosyltransferase
MALEQIQSLIRDVPDFPKPGIIFKDITPLLSDPKGFDTTIRMLADAAADFDAESILAIESRGFLFGAALALKLGLPIHLVRKKGKLPREAVAIQYELEYGVDHLEVHTDAIVEGSRYLIVDDVIATGGTAGAVGRLVEQQAGIVAGYAFVIELTSLSGRGQLGDRPIASLIKY